MRLVQLIFDGLLGCVLFVHDRASKPERFRGSGLLGVAFIPTLSYAPHGRLHLCWPSIARPDR
jgi:hypothetical protein